MNWEYKDTGKIIKEVPERAYGFIYVLEYEDGTKYLGKKVFYSTLTRERLKDSKKRKGHIKFTHKNIKGKRVLLEVFKQESNWRTYNGSSKEIPEGLKIVKKKILSIVTTKRRLTYMEAKYLFTLGVLEQTQYRNTNILGSFYQGNL